MGEGGFQGLQRGLSHTLPSLPRRLSTLEPHLKSLLIKRQEGTFGIETVWLLSLSRTMKSSKTVVSASGKPINI